MRYRLGLLIVTIICWMHIAEALPIEAQAPQILTNVANFEVSPSGNRMVVINTDGSAFLWNWETNNHLSDLEDVHLQLAENASFVWSADERYIAAGCGDAARVWDASTGNQLHNFEGVWDFESSGGGCSDSSLIFAFSPDNSLLAIGHIDGTTVVLWDITAGKIVRVMRLSQPEDHLLYTLQFAGNDTLVIETWTNVEVWDIRAYTLIRRFPTSFTGVASLSPDGTKLALGSGRFYSKVDIFDIASGDQLVSFQAPLVASSLAWTPDSRIVVGNFTDAYLVSEGDTYSGQSIRSWDIASGNLLNVFSVITPRTLGIKLKPDETFISVGNVYDNGSVLLLNQRTNEVYRANVSDTIQQTYNISTQNAYGVSLNRDQTLLGALVENEAVLWDVAKGEKVPLQHQSLLGMQFVYDVVIWNFASGEEVKRIEMNGNIRQFQFVSDDEFIILTADHTLRFETTHE